MIKGSGRHPATRKPALVWGLAGTLQRAPCDARRHFREQDTLARRNGAEERRAETSSETRASSLVRQGLRWWNSNL